MGRESIPRGAGAVVSAKRAAWGGGGRGEAVGSGMSRRGKGVQRRQEWGEVRRGAERGSSGRPWKVHSQV